MKRFAKFSISTVLTLIVVAGAGWWAVGPTWRTFLADPPSDTDVLFWTQDQRNTGFALADKLPMISTKTIAAGDNVRDLPVGDPLTLKVDVDAFMKQQNSAALIIVQGGKVRLEKYGLDQTHDKRWTSFSVAKSLTSTLVGAALKDGHIKSLDDKVSTYIPGLEGSVYSDVSVHQLLTMTSGVKWNEDYSDPNSDVAKFRSVEIVDGESTVVSYLKTLPRAHPPGEVFNYSTGETNLVGVLIARATGVPLSQYLSEKIWKPFGMQQDATWVVSDTGDEISGCCIQATTRDFARFGMFILEGGKANGEQVVPADWIPKATRVQVELEDDPIRNYGYQWWILDEGAFMAIGIFGQAIFIDPKRELVMASNSSWLDARGEKSGQMKERYAFFNAVRKALDNETKPEH